MFPHALRSSLTIVLALLWGAPLTLPASAAEVETHSLKVRTSDLDLGTDAGAAALNARIAAAARAVCGTADSRVLADAERARACRDAAMEDASRLAEIAIAAARTPTNYAGASKPTVVVAAR